MQEAGSFCLAFRREARGLNVLLSTDGISLSVPFDLKPLVMSNMVLCFTLRPILTRWNDTLSRGLQDFHWF